MPVSMRDVLIATATCAMYTSVMKSLRFVDAKKTTQEQHHGPPFRTMTHCLSDILSPKPHQNPLPGEVPTLLYPEILD
jgi:hypothetical protein